MPEMGTAAACSKLRLPGLGANLVALAQVSSANEPLDRAVDVVAGRELHHALADRLNRSGHVPATD
jgi:hypothetical protein